MKRKFYVQYTKDGVVGGKHFETEQEAKAFIEDKKLGKYTLFKMGPLASEVHIQLDSDHYTVLDTTEAYYAPHKAKETPAQSTPSTVNDRGVPQEQHSTPSTPSPDAQGMEKLESTCKKMGKYGSVQVTKMPDGWIVDAYDMRGRMVDCEFVKKSATKNDLAITGQVGFRVWVDQMELEIDPKVKAIIASGASDDEKRQQIIDVARDMAQDNFSTAIAEAGRLGVDFGGSSLGDIDPDRIDWESLLRPTE